ncbi:LacI family DNA-binding transcriptional regulator [Wenxinia saemankumensis]|uniref:Transcriptional regulator, LacI family n=1 Tax=Wenxinia saemankumensis TaxID=1447782 RepID=A0A1M6AMR1_9RHOB|nr:LacI family DNA-binding transcriptional regulator [Wenxinia saemankumensis]SHI37799.1 transcriptional regulator, LacI family [Wenxinia saemankumensis]
MPPRKDTEGRRGPVTLRNIADRVGVSVATVSRVLNFDPALSVSEATRQSVIETAEAMNYEPRRRRPRAVAPTGLKRIALLHFRGPRSELADPYFVAMRLGIETRCAALQLEVTKIYRGEDDSPARIPREAKGVIVIGRHPDEEIAVLRARHPNLVFVDWAPPGDDVDCVASDLELAATKLLTGLEGLGYRRIAFAGWAEDTDATTPEARARAYRAWAEGRGAFDPDLLRIGVNSEQSGHDVTGAFLSLPRPPDAIVVSNDTMAMGAYRAIQERGLKIPGDVALASFNDISAARFLSPPLTTVRLPAEAIGVQAVDLLAERMSGRDLARQVKIETKIAWRSSTRSAAPARAPRDRTDGPAAGRATGPAAGQAAE